MTALDQAIRAQPALLRELLALDVGDAVERLRPATRTWLVGTGTSQHAAELGAGMLRLAGIDATAESSAAFARRLPTVTPTDSIVLITHTGETAFARRVRQGALERGASLVSLTARGVGWPEALEVAPREQSETYTASYTAVLLALARISSALGAAELDQGTLEAVPDAAEAALDDPLPAVDPERRLVAIVGSGPGATTAREGALKLREAARMLCEGYEGEYLLHGSAVPLGPSDQLILLQPETDPDRLLPALGVAAEAEGIAVSRIADPTPLDPLLLQIPLTIRLQRLAAELAAARGVDPDRVILGGWADDALWG